MNHHSIIIILFVIPLFILMYLFFVSPIMKRKTLLVLMVIIAVLGIITVCIHRTDQSHDVKIAFLPMTCSDTLPSKDLWIAFALPYMISNHLSQQCDPDMLIISYESTYRSVPVDSINSVKYIEQLHRLTNVDLFIYSELDIAADEYTFSYQIRSGLESQNESSLTFATGNLLRSVEQVVADLYSILSSGDAMHREFKHSDDLTALSYFFNGILEKINGSGDKAFDYFQKTISRDSSFAMAYTLASECLFNDAVDTYMDGNSGGDYEFERIKSYLVKSIEIDSSLDDNYRLLGRIYQYQDRWNISSDYLDQALALNKKNPLTYIALSKLHPSRLKSYGFNDEHDLLSTALSLNPFLEEIYVAISDHYLFNNRRDHAINILEDYRNIDPRSIPVLMALSKIYIVMKEFTQADALIARVIEQDAKNDDAWFNRGIIYYHLDRFDDASDCFRESLRLGHHIDSYLYLAYIAELEGDINNSIEYLRKRIHFRRGPDDEFAEEARRHLVKLLSENAINDSVSVDYE